MLQFGAETLVKHYIEFKPEQESFEGLSNFIKTTKNKNVTLLAQLTFEHILGYFVLKAGIRQCNYKYWWTRKSMVKNVFRRVLRDSTPRFVGCWSVCQSVRWSIGPSHFTFFGFLQSLASLLLPKWSSDHKYGPCPPARHWVAVYPALFSHILSRVHTGQLVGWLVGRLVSWSHFTFFMILFFNLNAPAQMV